MEGDIYIDRVAEVCQAEPLLLSNKLPMPKFDRFTPSLNRTFALRNFNLCETEINEHFWSFKVISEHSRYLAHQQSKVDSSFATAKLFHATGPDARRIPPTVTDWLEAREELENWLRLSAIVSAAAYHERYLRQVIRSALMADPLVREGASGSIDGTIFLKRRVELPFDHEQSLITRGEWSSRAANFERLFGQPGAEAFPIAELEEIRRARNDFAHGFGRGLDTPAPSEVVKEPARRIKQKKFLELIAVLSRSAKVIDAHLLATFIKEYEVVHAYHSWRLMLTKREPGQSEVRAFQRHIHGNLGISKSQEFCRELIAYYENVP